MQGTIIMDVIRFQMKQEIINTPLKGLTFVLKMMNSANFILI